MKHPELFLLLLIICNVPSFSQPFHGGLFIGFTASQVDGDSYAGYNKGGIQGGVFVSSKITGELGARLEIRYSGRGAKSPMSDDHTELYQLGLHYIDVPILATYNIKKFGAFELGLIPAYLVRAGGKDENGKLSPESLVDFHWFDLGTLVGLSVNITPKIALNFRYSYSIFSMRDQETSGAYYSWLGRLFGYSTGDYNNYLSFGVNYLIR
jgi:hypothetical protein